MSQWTDARKQNPKERGTYLTLSFYFGQPEWKIMNYGTSRKWDNGRNKSLPMNMRVRYWMPLPPPPETPNE